MLHFCGYWMHFQRMKATKRTPKKSTQQWPVIRRIEHANGSATFQVDTRTLNGERRNFKFIGEAENYAQECRVLRINQGRDAFDISPTLRRMALEGDAKLKPYGVTLEDAVNFMLPHLEARNQSRTLEQAIDELVSLKRQDGKRDRYISDLRNRLTAFARDIGPQTLVADITRDTVERWARSLGVAPVTRNNFRRLLVVFFNFAKESGYCADNPAETLKTATVEEEEPGVLTVAEMQRLLEVAPAKMIPYIAIAGFLGIRRQEIERLDWKHIDIESREIDIPGAVAKGKKRRIITMNETLAAWLEPHVKESGRIVVGLAKNLPKMVEAAGIDEWPDNALRHSFASYHLAAFQDSAATAFIMGHRDSNMVYSKYAKAVKEADALKWWALRP